MKIWHSVQDDSAVQLISRAVTEETAKAKTSANLWLDISNMLFPRDSDSKWDAVVNLLSYDPPDKMTSNEFSVFLGRRHGVLFIFSLQEYV